VSRKSQIVLPGNDSVQTGLFTSSTKEKYYPKVYRDEGNYWRIVEQGIKEGYLGLDFEFPETYRASVVGVASKGQCCAIPATTNITSKTILPCLEKGIKLVGHSVIGAEQKVIKVTCGIDTPLSLYDDSMLRHYLLNADLAKAPDKTEADDAGALGFMGLWTAASMVLLWPNWKQCQGMDCEQTICPTHDVLGYCAVDAAASLEANYLQIKDLQKWKVPDKLYQELKELTYIAQCMQEQGVRVNMQFVKEMEKKAGEYKSSLFDESKEFNPRAPSQVVEWFKKNGIQLAGNDKVSIRRSLEKTAEKYGYSTHDETGKFSLEALELSATLPKELDALYRLYEYKSAGKGLDPWFGDKYIKNDCYIHPRFITIGASTSRWSSSRPNFTNIPARGFGSLVKAAIVPRDPSLDLIHADSSNLELRVCIYLAGYDPSEILPGDPFTWLVENSNGAFEEIARINNDTPRGVAKTVSHASNYLEGIKILYPRDLINPFYKKQIDAGALYVYRDWEYCGGVVAFTGANLAERIFGNKTLESRKRALAITEEVYFKRLPMLRNWHRKILHEIENKKYIQYPTGHFLRLYGNPTDNAKMGAAAYGQGVGAHYVQGQVLRFYRETGKIPLMFVHDSLDFEIPRTWTPEEAKDFIKLMGEENDRLPGFKCPYKAARGQCGLEFDEKKKETHIPGAMIKI